MCGIAAIFAYSSDAPNVDRGELIAMRDHMVTRGPDGCGEYFSPDERLALGHRRLSIIDLSEAGAQPMWTADRRYAVIFNGEIYNYRALRSQLQARGCTFRTGTDTEVLLHLYAEHGPDMIHQLRGMFAFAIWDDHARTLFLARDPFGIKPLYYADDGRTIRIASQVKALLQSQHIETAPEPAGHVGFFLWGSVPDPFTLYRGIKALPAGHTLTIHGSAGGSPAPLGVSPKEFCSVPALLGTARSEPLASSSDLPSTISHLRSVIADSIEHHLVADVPVGVFLSAGLDSTTLASYVCAGHESVRTVTLGFDEYRDTPQDEVPLAESTARALGTQHKTERLTQDEFEAEAERLLRAMDQPSLDGVNTYFVCRAARRAGLKVALSGLGADELFGGYQSFREIPRLISAHNRFRWLLGGVGGPSLATPSVMRRAAGGEMNGNPRGKFLGRSFRLLTAPVLKRFTSPKYAGLLELGGSYSGAYLLRRGLFMPWELPDLLGADCAREGWARLQPFLRLDELVSGLGSPNLKVTALETCAYMRHQLLRDTDWASMAHSVEIRVPFVDLELLRAVVPLLQSSTPPSKKDMARSAPSQLPSAIMSRPKTGFTTPIRKWLLRSQPSTINHQPHSRERGLRGWARFVHSQFTSN
jgi:asparagine synthase (glutamine-hydrolysing)